MSKYLIDRLTKSTKFVISSGGKGTKFGMRDLPALNMKNNYHIGNDYNTPVGTKLYAPCDGIVLRTRRVGNANDYGNQIFFYMEDYGYTLHLAHLSDIGPIEDKTLKEGDYLGATGNTGKSTGPHLHLGVAKGRKLNAEKGTYGDGTWVDPSTFYIQDKPEPKGKEVIVNGILHRDSAGSGPGKTLNNHKGRITREAKGAKFPYHIDSLGWVSAEAIGEKADKPTPAPVAPKPVAPKPDTVKIAGKIKLFVASTGTDTYPVPSKDKITNVKESTVDVIDRKNGRTLVRVPRFSPTDVWLDDSVVKGSNPVAPKPVAPKPVAPAPTKNEYGQNVKVGDTIDFSMLYTSVNGGTKFVATSTGSNQNISRRYIATRKVNGKDVQVYRAKVGKIYPKSSGYPNAYEVLTENGAILGRVNPINTY